MYLTDFTLPFLDLTGGNQFQFLQVVADSRFLTINQSLPDLMMGLKAPSPLLRWMPPTKKSAPRRLQLPDFLETILAPPVPGGALTRGDLISILSVSPVFVVPE